MRERFTALRNPLAFFDGPAGTQVPDSVIEAIAAYLQAANANLGGAFATSKMSDGVVDAARVAASELLGAYADEVIFGANMTTLNFALTRTAAREWSAGDEVVATKLDHDANISPWLELAHDKGITVHLCDFDGEGRLDLDHLRSLRLATARASSRSRGPRTRSARSRRSRRSSRSRTRRARSPGATPCTTRRTGRSTSQKVAVDVLLCSPYKFYGPHLGRRGGAPRAARALAPVQGAPGAGVPVRPPLRDGHARARAALRASSPRSSTCR